MCFFCLGERQVYKLFDQLACAPGPNEEVAPPRDIPDDIYAWASCLVYLHCLRSYDVRRSLVPRVD